jgi:DNA-binding MurR/RpiR family transcriptional regulator
LTARHVRVSILGLHYGSPLTVYCGYALTNIKPNVQAFTQADSPLYDRMRLMDAGDVLIAIAFPVLGRRLAGEDERLAGASQRPSAKRSDK